MVADRMRRLDYAAFFLITGYGLTVVLNFLQLEPVQLGNGNWLFTERIDLTRTALIIYFVSMGLSLLPVYFFVSNYMAYRIHSPIHDGYTPGFRDVVYYFAFYQIGYGLYNLFYLFAPWPLFEEGTIPFILEKGFFHFLMIGFFMYMFSSRARWFGFKAPRSWLKAVMTVVFLFVVVNYTLDILVTYPVAELFHIEIDSWREDQITREISMTKQYGWFHILLQIVMIGFIVPLGEEIMFRGVLQSAAVQKWGARTGILLSSLIFAVIHIDPALMAPLFVLGLVLGWCRHYFQSIWVAVLFHVLNNTYITVYQFFWYSG